MKIGIYTLEETADIKLEEDIKLHHILNQVALHTDQEDMKKWILQDKKASFL